MDPRKFFDPERAARLRKEIFDKWGDGSVDAMNGAADAIRKQMEDDALSEKFEGGTSTAVSPSIHDNWYKNKTATEIVQELHDMSLELASSQENVIKKGIRNLLHVTYISENADDEDTLEANIEPDRINVLVFPEDLPNSMSTLSGKVASYIRSGSLSGHVPFTVIMSGRGYETKEELLDGVIDYIFNDVNQSRDTLGSKMGVRVGLFPPSAGLNLGTVGEVYDEQHIKPHNPFIGRESFRRRKKGRN